MVWLYGLSNVWLLIIFMALAVIIMIAGQVFCHFFVNRLVPQEGNELASKMHETIVTLTSLVLAFSMVEVINNVHDVEKAAVNEAATIVELDRMLAHYHDEVAQRSKQELYSYTKSIIEDEWPELVKGSSSPKTAMLLDKTLLSIAQIVAETPQKVVLYNNTVSLGNQLTQLRDIRLTYAESELPSIYWAVMILFFLASIIVSSMLERSLIGTIAVGFQTAALAGVFALVFIFDQPFKGESGVKPVAFEKNLGALKNNHLDH